MVNKKYLYIGIAIALVVLASVLATIFSFTTYPYEETEELNVTYCTAEQRDAEACIMIYAPVCGFREDGTSATYENSCLACMDSEIVYWKNGEC